MKTIVTISVLAVTMLVLGGCGSGQQEEVGFLSDYSKLMKESDSILRYVNQKKVGNYSAIIVDPVEVHLQSKAKAKDEAKLTQQQIEDLANYFQDAIVREIAKSGKKIAYQPGPGVARLRVALTDIEKSDAISMLPQASLAGVGIGGASVEAELIDSVTEEQLAVTVQSRTGSRVPFSTLGDWTAAKQVMDKWAKEMSKRLM
jgi:hypothetical protein